MERFYDYWTGGDPAIRKRFLIQSIFPMVAILISYVSFVKYVGPYVMMNRKPLEFKKIIIVHNIGLVAFYLYFLIRGVLILPVMRLAFFCGPLNSNEHPIIPEIFDLLYQIYFVRYIELLDTVYMVLNKKYHTITNLHLFHHTIIPIFGWFGIRSEKGGYLALLLGLNSFVHIIMYTYYSIAALGPEYYKYLWWKKYLTALQILQFLLMAIYINVMHLIGCTSSEFTFRFSIGLMVIFFFMFLNYYRTAFSEKNKASTLKIEVRTPNGPKKKNSSVKKGTASIVTYRNAAKKE